MAAGVALGVGELVTGIGSRQQSLVGSVGSLFIHESGGGVARTAISVLGTADKPSLILGIVLTSLLIGAALGSAGRRRPWIPVVGFAAFALTGVIAAAKDPLASVPLAVVAALLAAGAGVVTLFVLLSIARTGHFPLAAPPPPPATARGQGPSHRHGRARAGPSSGGPPRQAPSA